MNAETTLKTAIGFFVTVLIGALLSAVLGGAFGGCMKEESK